MNQFILYSFSLLWFLTIVYYTIKTKKEGALRIGTAGVILISYFIYSIFSVLLYKSNSYFGNSANITVFPFIYLYSMEMLFLYPMMRYNPEKTQLCHPTNLLLFNIISIVFIFSSLIHFPSVIVSFKEGLYQILLHSYGGADLYAEKMEQSYENGEGIKNIFAIFSLAFSGIGILFLFYSFVNKKVNKWIKIGLLLSFVVLLLNGVSSGQRGLLVEPLYVAIVTYFFFRPYINKKINKIISIVGIGVLVAASVPFVALTVSRFDNKNSDVRESVFYYAGQENIYFNMYCLDDGGIRYGDRTIPLFKRMLGISNVPKNFWERRAKYPNLKINDEVFYTYVGDFTIDYGPFLGTLVMLLMALFFSKTTIAHNGQIKFEQVIILHSLMYMCMVGGLKLFPFSDVAGNLKIIVYYTAYILFKYFTIQKTNQYDTKS